MGVKAQDVGTVLTVRPADSDAVLAEAYWRMSSAGLMRVVFGCQEPSLVQFVEARKSLPSLACYESDDLVGMAWMNSLSEDGGGAKRADVTIVMFRDGLSGAQKALFGRKLLSWAFEILGVDVVLALVSEFNRRAQVYARRLGFSMFGPIPLIASWDGIPCGGWIGALTKARWDEKRREVVSDVE